MAQPAGFVTSALTVLDDGCGAVSLSIPGGAVAGGVAADGDDDGVGDGDGDDSGAQYDDADTDGMRYGCSARSYGMCVMR